MLILEDALVMVVLQQEWQVFMKSVPVLQVDNSAAVRVAQNPKFHRKTLLHQRKGNRGSFKYLLNLIKTRLQILSNIMGLM